MEHLDLYRMAMHRRLVEGGLHQRRKAAPGFTLRGQSLIAQHVKLTDLGRILGTLEIRSLLSFVDTGTGILNSLAQPAFRARPQTILVTPENLRNVGARM